MTPSNLIQLHANAIHAFDKQANLLPGLICEFPTDPATGEANPSDVYVSGAFGSDDIIGEIRETKVDYRGRVVMRFFRSNGKKLGLSKEGHGALLKVVAAMRRVPAVESHLSGKYIEEQLFEWVRKRFETSDAAESFCSFLLEAANADIREHSLWVPVANLQVTAPFQFGHVEVRPISKAMVDDWERSILAEHEGDPSDARAYFVRIRKRFQGYAAICTSIVAEPERAMAQALENAESATLYLASFSVGTLDPHIRCVSAITGSEVIRQASVIEVSHDAPPRLSSRVLDLPEVWPWLLDTEALSQLRTVGFEELSALLRLEEPNDFQRAVLSAFALYGKAAFAFEPIDKIVYILASLESLLLKSTSEPIQDKLGDRIAFFVSREGAERKKIIAQVRSAYGRRSKYLHHGKTEGEYEEIGDFFRTVWVFYSQVLMNSGRFEDRIKFIDTIDDIRLGL